MKIISYIFLILTALTSNTSAQIIDSEFYRFSVYEMQDNEFDEKKCYIVARPVKSDSSGSYRKKPYIMITRYQNRRIEQVSVYSGYEYKLNSKILVAIDDEKFQLSTNKDMAWAMSSFYDVLIIQKMLKSAVLKVRADSAIGSYTVDEYSLKGITRAYARMRKICK